MGERLFHVDPLGDAAASALAALPKGQGFRMLDTALSKGISAVDAAPDALTALIADTERRPFWVDLRRVERGGAVFLRAGILGGIVLGVESLILGYASPGGNKPLVFTGALEERAARRVGETARFVEAVSRPGGMARFGDGFAISVKVRVMHAEVRRLIGASKGWRRELWGEPINQHDMAATIILFSAVVVDGLRKLGHALSSEETEELMHLWSYVAHLMGVEHDLIPRSFDDASRTARMIEATQGPPDDDSRALTKAFIESGLRSARTEAERAAARRRIHVAHGVCHALLGDQLADQLAIPRGSLRYALPVLRAFVKTSGLALQRLPLDGYRQRLGERYWRSAIHLALRGKPAEFRPPEGLAHA